MSKTPNARDPFKKSKGQTTDLQALNHIVSGKIFHITSGKDTGEYVFQTGRSGNRITGLFEIKNGTRERSSLTTQSLLDAIIGIQISLDSTSSTREAKPTPMNLFFLEHISDENGFHITSGFGSGNYGFKTDSGKIILKKLVVQIVMGQIAGFSYEHPNLPATAFLTALQKDNLRVGIEDTIVFNIAKEQMSYQQRPSLKM